MILCPALSEKQKEELVVQSDESSPQRKYF